MKQILFLVLFTGIFFNTSAQDNVAEIAHNFIKAVKQNDLKIISPRFLEVNAAYAVLPKESTGMNARQKNDTYLKPLYETFKNNFDKIQKQIVSQNVTAGKIDLVSYKMGKIDPKASETQGKQKLPQAMSLFFNYNKKEYVIPISVVEIDERWYILEILYVTDLFK